jgi:two-component system, NarL family, nitrate/nitrite response regulator NarL
VRAGVEGVAAASRTPRQGSAAPTVPVLVVSDVRLYRHGLAEILARHEGVEVVGTAANAADALAAAHSHPAALVLLDVTMPGGVETIRAVVRALPAAKVLALTVGDDEEQVIAWAEAGVSGYVTRESSLEELVAAIDGAQRGEVICSPRLAATLLRRVRSLSAGVPASTGDEPPLTARELEIVDLLDAGLSNKEIASRLFIEVATVKNHVHNILEKLRVRRRSEVGAILRARRAGSGSMDTGRSPTI